MGRRDSGRSSRQMRSADSNGFENVTGPSAQSSNTTPSARRVDVPWNIIAMDFGTETYSATHYLMEPGEPFDNSKVTRVLLSSDRDHDYVGPTIAAYHGQDWVLGKELEDRLQDIPADKIIRQFKLALYDPHKESYEAQNVQRQLDEAGQTLDQLLAAFFRYLWNDVWNYVDNEVLQCGQKPGISETLVYITVPILVTSDAVERLSEAAKKAGIVNFAFLHEPLCAAASVLDDIIKKGTLQTPDGSSALVVDCGGGTTDGVLVRLCTSKGGPVHQMLQQIGEPDGERCGSSSVDVSFRQWMLQEWPSRGGFKKARQKLKLSEEHVIHQATVLFKDHKEKFPRAPGGGFKEIYVHAKKGTGIKVPLNYNQIKSLFDPHIRRIAALIRRLLKDDTKFIFLTGGLSSNPYFCNEIKREFETSTCSVKLPPRDWHECPVALGAQMMEHIVDLNSIPSLFALGIVNDTEKFNKRLHKDALNARGKPRNDMVFSEYWFSGKKPYYVVQDRIVWLVTQGNTVGPHADHHLSRKLPQQYEIPMNSPSFKIRTVFTRNRHVMDHEPLLEPKEEKPNEDGPNKDKRSGDVRKEFEVEKLKVHIPPDVVKYLAENSPVPNLSPGPDEHGNPLPEEPHLQFYARVSLWVSNKEVKAGVEIIDPKKYKPRAGRKLSQKELMGPAMKEKWMKIWSSDTNVLKSSLPAPTAEASGTYHTPQPVTAGPSAPSRRVTGHEAHDVATQVTQLLQDELEVSAEAPDNSITLARRAVLNNAGTRNASGKKRAPDETHASPSKRTNRGPRTMTPPDINSRASAGPSVVSYEWPGSSNGQY